MLDNYSLGLGLASQTGRGRSWRSNVKKLEIFGSIHYQQNRCPHEVMTGSSKASCSSARQTGHNAAMVPAIVTDRLVRSEVEGHWTVSRLS